MPPGPASASIVLDATHINQIAGGTLADGNHTLNLLAIAKAGNVKTFSLTFTLDTQSPSAPVLDLSPASDTGVVGDHTTNLASVTLRGSTEPNAAVSLLTLGRNTKADASGSFQFTNV